MTEGPPAGLRVTVVICAYTERRWAELSRAIASVRGQSRPVDQLVVVVDHDEALLDRVRAELPATRALANTEEPGLSGARNTGVAAAAATSSPSSTTTPSRSRTGSSACSSATRTRKSGRRRHVRRGLARNRRTGSAASSTGWSAAATGASPRSAPVRNVIGANMSFRRDVLAARGGFDA